MKSCDFNAGAAKLELALKTLRTTLNAVDQQWNDEAKRKFWDNHIAQLDPSLRTMFDAIGRLSEAVAAAERDCASE
jgi:hypothetical protein